MLNDEQPSTPGAGAAACPACGGAAAGSIYQVAAAPVTCGSIFNSPEEARAVPTGPIDLHLCDRCGFVFNAIFDPRLAALAEGYESSQAASPQHGAFTRGLASDWVNRYALRGRTVLEVGCGHGDFMLDLLDAGAGRVIGVDPLIGRVRTVSDPEGRVELIPAEFDQHSEQLAADALVCRHTLEHVPDVAGFLRAVAGWAARAPGRTVLFEVPTCELIFEQGGFWDVLYEHCNYFTAPTAEYAFAQAGLEVLRTSFAYDGQYLLIEARAADARTAALFDPERVRTSQDAARRFGAIAAAAIDHARRNMQALAEEGTFVLWQGAAKTVGLLTALGAPPQLRGAVDLSRQRQGLYLPGSALQVLAPDEIPSLAPRHVVLVNAIYRNEVATALRALHSTAHLFTMNDLCEGPVLDRA